MLKFKEVEDFGRYAECVEDKKEVLKLLKDVSFNIKETSRSYKGYNYNITIKKGDIIKRFSYWEGIGNEEMTTENQYEKLLNAIYCLTMDWEAYNMSDSFSDFCSSYGYEENKDSKKIYDSCRKNYEKLNSIFSQEEINLLLDKVRL